MSRDLGFGPFSEALSGDDHKALRGAFLDRLGDRRSTRAQLTADVTPILNILRAEPLDAVALETALDDFQRGFNDRIALGRSLKVERIVAMTPAERAAFVDRMEHALERRGE